MITLVGLGYDIHRFSETERPLWLGGVQVHPTRGLAGHSDADVLCHALADAILGAIGEPDIGYWFPPGDESCKNICSLRIVEKAVELLHAQGGRVVNVDCALIAEAPKIMPFVQQMKETLAPILGVSPRRVGVKATTNEKLGALGRREGMAAFATVAVQVPDEN
ncbi:MAG: 2-C-methyl-D-erythritol 2,4-cyclodiphosphate synthase [Akkermansia sp.]|nr:2-C-methyl-D-erythritol 2,4-cyclodiphosphate synthase [Akkermansia sp.]